MREKNKLIIFALVALFIIAFLLRLYRFDNPIADWHSWRQSETSSVARIFATEGFDLLHPQMVNLSNVQSGFPNPQGYFFVEFPLATAAQAGLFVLFGVFTIEQWGRLISIVSSLISALFLYLLVSRHSNKAIGFWTTFFFLFIPFNIYYSRTILPEVPLVMAMLGAIYFFDRWIALRIKKKESSTHWLWFIAAFGFTASAFLLKPYALFFTLPMVYLAYKAWGGKLIIQWQVWLFTLLALSPLVAWRIWMTQFPEGIPANIWLLNGNGIRFRPSFFRWMVYERLTILISGYFGMILLVVGIFKLRVLKEWGFFLAFLLSSVLYVSVIATGNVQHDYYQILIIPSISIFLGIGSYFLYRWSPKRIQVGKVILLICIVGGFFFSWQRVQDYFNINNPSIIIAGEAVERLTPKDAKVIANYNGDTTFLYQTNRRGWASFEKDIPVMIQMGADYLVLANPTEQDMGFAKEYKVLKKTKEYVIFDLQKKP